MGLTPKMMDDLTSEQVLAELRAVEAKLIHDMKFKAEFCAAKGTPRHGLGPNAPRKNNAATVARAIIREAIRDFGGENWSLASNSTLNAYAREQLRRRFAEIWGVPKQRDESSCSKIPTINYWEDAEDVEGVSQQQPSPQPQPKEDTMSIIKIETKTFVNGTDITSWNDGDIYNLIAQQEKDIEKLEDIQNKPKRLENEIAERKAGIQALVDHLNARDAK